MVFSSPLIKGTLVKRYKRFLADIELEAGHLVTAHCPNTGAMTGCAEPGFETWLRFSDDPKRKLAYTWELARNQAGEWIGINTHNANKLCVEAISSGKLPELVGYQHLNTEKKYGSENSRIDILLSDPDRVDCYIEVKSVTLAENGRGWFPDAKTARGTKHLRELAEVAEQGNRAILLFCVQHTGIKTVEVASHIDPEYAAQFYHAVESGVEVLAYACDFSTEKVVLNQRLDVKLAK